MTISLTDPFLKVHTNSLFLAIGMLVAGSGAGGWAQTTNEWRVSAGPLALEIHISRTAHLFHVVDQVSQWSEFCHRQYVTWIESTGGLSQEERGLLKEHAAIRRKRGWGGGLEPTFYTPLELEPALARGVKEGWLTAAEANAERRILTEFRPRVERLMASESGVSEQFVRQVIERQSELSDFANTLSRFVGCTKLVVPFYVIANPDDWSSGGGYNGGRLTLEIARKADVYPSLLHELFHAFVATKAEQIAAAARAVPGLDAETLNEGLAYAYNPGLVHTGDGDPLLDTVAGYAAKGVSLRDSYPRFNYYGLALRPLLKGALADPRQTLGSFLPRATDAWQVLVELERAREAKGAPAQDYRKDPRHSVFIFGLWDDEACQELTAGRHCFGRNHVAEQYQEMLSKNAKPGDAVILLISLDDPGSRVPAEHADLLPSAWSTIEAQLKKGEVVFQEGKAREMSVFLLAAPTVEELRKEFRRLAAGKKFSL